MDFSLNTEINTKKPKNKKVKKEFMISKQSIELKEEVKEKKEEIKTVPSLIFPKFEENQVSTKTFIILTNLKIDKAKIFDFLPITEYIIIPKKRGRKKKTPVIDYNKDIKDGSIISIESSCKTRGVSFKKKKKNDNKKIDYFRNSITVVMIIDSKKINFKICGNGKFQMTGCKSDLQAEKCIYYIWNYIKDNKDLYYLIDFKDINNPNVKSNKENNDEKEEDEDEKQTEFMAIFIPSMRNIDFSLGFTLYREKLDQYINNHTEYVSLLETSIGYTAVNIKVPHKHPITDLKLKKLVYDEKENDWKNPTYVPYSVFLDTLKPKDVTRKLTQDRYHTFLVFHSGKCIMSTMCDQFGPEIYYEFLEMIRNSWKEYIERVL
jgi:hypothetical protein